jgi:hypothetical protein
MVPIPRQKLSQIFQKWAASSSDGVVDPPDTSDFPQPFTHDLSHVRSLLDFIVEVVQSPSLM